MTLVSTTKHGAFRPDYLEQWMFGEIVGATTKQVTLIDPQQSTSYKGIYYGDFNLDNSGNIYGAITSFTYIFRDPSYTFLTFININANAATVFEMIRKSDVQSLLSYILRGNDEIDATVVQSYYGSSIINGYAGNDTIKAGLGDDSLFGGIGDDYLAGNAGQDTLEGGAGADTMVGGTGNDNYAVDNVADRVIEITYAGTDTVRASISYALAANVENLILVGAGHINGTGNAGNNVITGNAGNNILHDGGAGAADQLVGLGGNDTYRIFNAGDIIVESAAQGTADRVIAAVDYVLKSGVYVEVMTTNGSTGTLAIDLIGNEIGQKIVANAGANVVDGKGGIDTLTGGNGKDYFIFSTGLGAANVDTITDFKAVDDTIRLENAVFTAFPSTGTLSAGYFKDIAIGTKDANDRIIYNSDTGALYYDADGSGVAFGNVKFGVLSGSPALTAADFVVI